MFRTLHRKIAPPAIEQRNIDLSGKSISYTLKRSGKRRSIGLRIDERGLTVSMPLRASEKWLHSVLQDKAEWVVEKMAGWQDRQAPVIQWRDGERIPFCGGTLILRVAPDLFGAPPALRGEILHLQLADAVTPQNIAHTIEQWYRQQALHLFAERVAYFAPLLQVAPRALKLSAARSQWGSCTVRGVVRLNWRLIKLPLTLIDYVVVHELAHLVEMNHSAAFWQVVEQGCQDYRLRRGQLRDCRIGD
ncbi:MAG: SprT family zinc-dependent metalloprotease [Sideroxyarcus sp.]|nr:SprT family zinc-dependent metalloprotease [Sideroxyarcus sp.]